MLMDTSGRRRLMALVAVSAIAISACGSGGGTAAPAASAPAASAPAASEPAASAPASAPAASSGAERQHRRDLAVGRQRAGVVPEGPGRLQRQDGHARPPTSRSGPTTPPSCRPASPAATRRTCRSCRASASCAASPGTARSRRSTSLGIDPAALEAGYAPGVLDIGKVDGELYAIMVKFNSKSTLWYRPDQFTEAGVTPPEDLGRVQGGAQRPSPTRAPSRSAWAPRRHWTLTDWFESIYLRQAGADKYDQLFAGALPWTDPSVQTAVDTMKEVLNDNYVAGGITAANGRAWVDGIAQVFGDKPGRGHVLRGWLRRWHRHRPGQHGPRARQDDRLDRLPVPRRTGRQPRDHRWRRHRGADRQAVREGVHHLHDDRRLGQRVGRDRRDHLADQGRRAPTPTRPTSSSARPPR